MTFLGHVLADLAAPTSTQMVLPGRLISSTKPQICRGQKYMGLYYFYPFSPGESSEVKKSVKTWKNNMKNDNNLISQVTVG